MDLQTKLLQRLRTRNESPQSRAEDFPGPPLNQHERQNRNASLRAATRSGAIKRSDVAIFRDFWDDIAW